MTKLWRFMWQKTNKFAQWYDDGMEKFHFNYEQSQSPSETVNKLGNSQLQATLSQNVGQQNTHKKFTTLGLSEWKFIDTNEDKAALLPQFLHQEVNSSSTNDMNSGSRVGEAKANKMRSIWFRQAAIK